MLWLAGSGPRSLPLHFRSGVAGGTSDSVGSAADSPGPQTPRRLLWSGKDLWDSGDINHPEALGTDQKNRSFGAL